MRWRTVKNDLQTTVKAGDVTLPCQVDKANAEAVKWDIGYETLCVNRNHKTRRCENVHSCYENRVEMAGLWKENGNASLELINATVSDTGTYECSVMLSGTSDLKNLTTINLTVEPGPVEIEVKPGDSVTLRCQHPSVAAITLLTWSRADLSTEDYVFFYRDKLSYERYQHPSYRGRVQLRDANMKDGDVSVTLKNVTINDTGTYECYVKKSNVGRNRSDSPVYTTQLKVTVLPAGLNQKDGNTHQHVGLMGAGVTVLVGVVVGFVISVKHKRRMKKKSPDEEACLQPTSNP